MVPLEPRYVLRVCLVRLLVLLCLVIHVDFFFFDDEKL